MKHEIKVYRLTLPKEVRDMAQIPRDGFVDISYNAEADSIIIKRIDDNVVDKESKKELDIPKVRHIVPRTSKPKIDKNKIEANFTDAGSLSKTVFSECGLVVRTKRRYIDNFCEKCKGQLAKEWEDRADVHCKYIDEEFEKNKAELEKIKNDVEQEENNEIDIKPIIPITEIKEQRKYDLEHISKSIKEANKVIDAEVERLTKSKKGRPKKLKRYSTPATTLQPVKSKDGSLLKCGECGEFYQSGFLVDDEFLCKECTKSDFKEFLKRRGMRNV